MTELNEHEPQTTYAKAILCVRLSCLGLVISSGIFAFEVIRVIYEWLRYGRSSNVVLSDWVTLPHWKWVGVQRGFEFVWSLPIWIIAFAATILLVWIWDGYNDQANALGKPK